MVGSGQSEIQRLETQGKVGVAAWSLKTVWGQASLLFRGPFL